MGIASRFKEEKFLVAALVVAAIAYFLEHAVIGMGRGVALIAAAGLVGTIVLASIRVAHHAELLAVKVGDPYGTMILTLSAVAVEVIILAIMMSGESSPTLVRDTIYSAVMLDINGILGLAALIGGLKHGEQPYNDNSGKTYGVMILTAMGISMIVPEFVPSDKWHYYSAFTIVAMIALYGLFLRMQVGQHSYFFSYSYPRSERKKESPEAHGPDESAAISIATILVGVVVIGAAGRVHGRLHDRGPARQRRADRRHRHRRRSDFGRAGNPDRVAGGARNRMQATVNIAMGASLSTVILTVPVMEAIALYTGQPFIMAMTPVQTVMVAITLIAAAINLNDGETNAIEGMTHFILFATFIMLTALGL